MTTPNENVSTPNAAQTQPPATTAPTTTTSSPPQQPGAVVQLGAGVFQATQSTSVFASTLRLRRL